MLMELITFVDRHEGAESQLMRTMCSAIVEKSSHRGFQVLGRQGERRSALRIVMMLIFD